MELNFSNALQVFQNQVGIKFQLFNSLFTSLPFHRIEKTGIFLALLTENCGEGYKRNQSPQEIVDQFFTKHTSLVNEQEKTDILFRFIHYVERQVVLFDALEDAAYRDIVDINGVGTLKHLTSEVTQAAAQDKLAEKLKDFSVKLVLTAHPTQFYPGTVLGIIHDLSNALKEGEISKINVYLQQLGKTPFLNQRRPTPYDEAMSLMWFMENVFYAAAGRLTTELKQYFPHAIDNNHPVISMGFWPGGDRDGNPNVNTETTVKVADALRSGILNAIIWR